MNAVERWALEPRIAYFLPAAKLMRQMYHNGGVNPGIEASLLVYDRLAVWANFNLFIREGQTKGLHTNSSIQLFPISSGLKYSIKIIDVLDIYFGIGPMVSWGLVHDHSVYVRQATSRVIFGVVGKSGLTYFLKTNGYFNFFADYSYGKINPIPIAGVQTHSINTGGLMVGLGIGVNF